MGSPPISMDEKREALARVLESRTFSRSDQLRGFLRYICEAEFEGRAHQLNEYALGISVLGRPSSYSPAEDSSVRTRAYELRNKLKNYYRAEAPADPIQIEIDKGAYIPRFDRREAAAPEAATAAAPEPAARATPATPEPIAPVEAPPARSPAGQPRSWLLAGAAALGGALVAALIALAIARGGRPAPAAPASAPAMTPELEALWRPFLDSSAPLLISFELRPFFYAPGTGLVVRDYKINQPGEVSQSKPLAAFQERMSAPELTVTYDYADFGAVHAAFLLGRLLNRDVALKHASSLGWEDVWNDNIIFLGKPNLNPAIRSILKEGDLDESDLGTVRNLHPLPGEPAEYRSATTHGAGLKYAVITVLPGPQRDRHIMILSGAGAELMWSLAQGVTNPALVKEIVSHVMPPGGERPPAFQVVIESMFESNVPVKTRYVTHRVLRAR